MPTACACAKQIKFGDLNTLAAPAQKPHLFSTRVVCKQGHPLDPTPLADLLQTFCRCARRLHFRKKTGKRTLSHGQRVALSRSFRGPSFRKVLLAVSGSCRKTLVTWPPRLHLRAKTPAGRTSGQAIGAGSPSPARNQFRQTRNANDEREKPYPWQWATATAPMFKLVCVSTKRIRQTHDFGTQAGAKHFPTLRLNKSARNSNIPHQP